MKECDNRKTTYKQQLHIVYMFCSNDAHLITKTSYILQHFTTLHRTTHTTLMDTSILSFTLH